MKRFTTATLLSVLISSASYAQTEDMAPDNRTIEYAEDGSYVVTMPDPEPQYKMSDTKYDWSALATSITFGKTTAYDKAHAIYRWLCDNIAYDTTHSIFDGDTAYEKQRGVCQAYCELFYRIGEAAGIRSEIIFGKSKDIYGKIDDMGHAWIFAYTDESTGILIDPTWGAGSVNEGRFKHTVNDDSWFHIDPYWLIFTHYPDENKYLFIEPQIDFNTFTALPSLKPELSQFGLKGEDILLMSLKGTVPDIPKFSAYNGIEIGSVPLSGSLKIGNIYDFSLKSNVGHEFVIINGSDYYEKWGNDNGWSAKFVPSEPGKLVLGFRKKGTDSSWTHLALYKVDNPTAEDNDRLEKNAPHKSPVLKALPKFNPDQLIQKGFDMARLLKTAKEENISKLPLIYKDGDFKVADIPYNGKLKAGKEYTFSFIPQEEGEWVLINGDTWLTEWQKDKSGKAWQMTVSPQTPGSLIFALKPKKSKENKYKFCIEYEVEK